MELSKIKEKVLAQFAKKENKLDEIYATGDGYLFADFNPGLNHAKQVKKTLYLFDSDGSSTVKFEPKKV